MVVILAILIIISFIVGVIFGYVYKGDFKITKVIIEKKIIDPSEDISDIIEEIEQESVVHDLYNVVGGMLSGEVDIDDR